MEMNTAHWHLVLNHIPLFGVAFGLVLLITGYFTRSELVKRIAFFTFIFTSIMCFAVLETGEGAEEFVNNLPHVSHSALEAHEHKAETTIWATTVLGVVSLFALIFSFQDKQIKNIAFVATLIVSLVAVFLVVETSMEGGKITHIEIRGSENR